MKSRHLSTLARLASALQARLADAAAAFGGDPTTVPDVVLMPARDPSHGDFATPVAMAAAKSWRRNPSEIAEAMARGGTAGLDQVASVTAAKPGFLNVRMSHAFWSAVVREVLERPDDYGRSDALAGVGPLLIEFASANPTGPLVVVQGRSGSLGATLVEMFRFGGAETKAETYVNDAGAQLDALADSLFARYATLCGVDTPVPEGGYPGDYIIDIAKRLHAVDGDRWLSVDPGTRRRALGKYGRDAIVEGQRADMERFGVHFDRWFSEATLHDSGAIDDAVNELLRGGHAYEREGAVWLRATDLGGDSEDRVLRRSDGRPTYLAADAAYHRDKLRRGNKYLINILGPDHHGYIARLKALVAAFGHPGSIEVLLAQQVTLKRGDEVVSMSKRAGNVVTLHEVMDEVGVDAARFFFIERAPESHLVFDLALAAERSQKNPVFYVQYGHARIASILRRAVDDGRQPALLRARAGEHVDLLTHAAEVALIRRLSDFERTVVEAARDRAPHRVAEFARNVAADFHGFYTDCVVLSDDEALTSARLSLCIAAKTVLASSLRILGVSTPDKM
jgi:arginyl-tRNA synthetase